MSRIAVLSLACLISTAALAGPPATLRGTIAAISGGALTIKTRTGETEAVRLSPKTQIVAAVRASVADLKPNTFVGVAAAPEGDGMKALEVHIFPESMRGTGEGFRPFDLAPGSTMTNGAAELKIGGVEGDKLTVTYKGGAQTIRLPRETPIVALAPGDRADLKPGAGAIARGVRSADGVFEAGSVIVGRNGVTPPM
jgi:hypothetical protein